MFEQWKGREPMRAVMIIDIQLSTISPEQLVFNSFNNCSAMQQKPKINKEIDFRKSSKI